MRRFPSLVDKHNFINNSYDLYSNNGCIKNLRSLSSFLELGHRFFLFLLLCVAVYMYIGLGISRISNKKRQISKAAYGRGVHSQDLAYNRF